MKAIENQRPPFPEIMGEQLTRKDMMERLWECYREAIKWTRGDQLMVGQFPGVEAILLYIEEHGLPPKEVS